MLSLAALRPVSDADLIVAMREGSSDACNEFVTRFRPILESYARRVRIPPWDATGCIQDILSDEALRFANNGITIPASLPAYLIRALRNRYLNVKRAASCRERHHAAASDRWTGEWVVTSLCSEAALRSSAGLEESAVRQLSVLERLATELRAGLTDEEHSILMWISQGASHREISAWLAVSYEATSKRIWRLCRRLRAQATDRAESYEVSERAEVERFLRRVSVPLVTEGKAVASGGAR
ncbi:MAG: hypothetical protein JWM41_4985 [Gemmatimonadetes bacterium]|nr:hypothetical protein [Gemmatimonadota bacterium]